MNQETNHDIVCRELLYLPMTANWVGVKEAEKQLSVGWSSLV